MKKFLLTAIIACFVFGVASAQEPGDWAVGPRVSFYSHAGAEGAVVGVGAIGRYSFTEHWRVEPALSILCKRDYSFDLGADMHYRFRLASVWDLYPAVGLSVNDMQGWSLGLNLGAGTDFHIARSWDLTAGFKWMLQSAKWHPNPLVITVGANYKF